MNYTPIFLLPWHAIEKGFWRNLTTNQFLICLPAGFLMTNFSEWFFHKYIQHGYGRKTNSFFGYHFFEHHRNARADNYRDLDYVKNSYFFAWNPQSKELVQLFMASLLPLLYIHRRPWLTFSNWLGAIVYFSLHRYSHLHPDWARRWMPWHWDHHMGRSQEANWCVTFPLIDYIMGTRVRYAGTQDERDDQAKLLKWRAEREKEREKEAEKAAAAAAEGDKTKSA